MKYPTIIDSQQLFREQDHPLKAGLDPKCRSTKPLCPDSFAKVMKSIDTFIFDADGVLWLGESVMPGSPRLIDYLVKHNKQIIVLTNNATKSRAVYAKKLAKLGYNSAKMNKNNLVNPAAVVADTLHRSGLDGKRVYLIGEQGLRDEMDELGIEYFGHGPEKNKNEEEGSGAFIKEKSDFGRNLHSSTVFVSKYENPGGMCE
uniref:4-nitrophenylphosphatase n=1 Tax=Caenorhabditis tropicalis TaxID=1561998 RepID=A0A1I7T7Y8_9PELO